jgi:hypothetical protein
VTESWLNYVEDSRNHAQPSNGIVGGIKEDVQITLGNERTRRSYWARGLKTAARPNLLSFLYPDITGLTGTQASHSTCNVFLYTAQFNCCTILVQESAAGRNVKIASRMPPFKPGGIVLPRKDPSKTQETKSLRR